MNCTSWLNWNEVLNVDSVLTSQRHCLPIYTWNKMQNFAKTKFLRNFFAQYGFYKKNNFNYIVEINLKKNKRSKFFCKHNSLVKNGRIFFTWNSNSKSEVATVFIFSPIWITLKKMQHNFVKMIANNRNFDWHHLHMITQSNIFNEIVFHKPYCTKIFQKNFVFAHYSFWILWMCFGSAPLHSYCV